MTELLQTATSLTNICNMSIAIIQCFNVCTKFKLRVQKEQRLSAAAPTMARSAAHKSRCENV